MGQPWALYNEIDPYAAEWLENLIAAGHIAPGIVDRRSIVDVEADGCTNLRRFIGSLVLQVGASRCAARATLTTDRYGPRAYPASRSARRANRKR